MNFLGDVLYERHPDSAALHYDAARKCSELAEQPKESLPANAWVFEENGGSNPLIKLAEMIASLLSRGLAREGVHKAVDSLSY
ncbi:MAG: hypothetical protein N3C12_01410 [Candidatus Binatia bacterium]|nr:hypothetical protein [Candidatus Binatia bacterium]